MSTVIRFSFLVYSLGALSAFSKVGSDKPTIYTTVTNCEE